MFPKQQTWPLLLLEALVLIPVPVGLLPLANSNCFNILLVKRLKIYSTRTVCIHLVMSTHALGEPFCEVISVSLHMSVITQWDKSALMMAVNGTEIIVSQLLEAGANTDLQDKVYTKHWRRCGLAEGVLLLYVVFYRELILDPSTHLARRLVCDEPFYEVISVSLHMSVITQDGDSALMAAVRRGRTEVVSLLLKAGANTDLKNKVCECKYARCGLGDVLTSTVLLLLYTHT